MHCYADEAHHQMERDVEDYRKVGIGCRCRGPAGACEGTQFVHNFGLESGLPRLEYLIDVDGCRKVGILVRRRGFVGRCGALLSYFLWHVCILPRHDLTVYFLLLTESCFEENLKLVGCWGEWEEEDIYIYSLVLNARVQ